MLNAMAPDSPIGQSRSIPWNHPSHRSSLEFSGRCRHYIVAMGHQKSKYCVERMLAFAVTTSAIAGSPCVPHWDTTIGNPGPNGEAYAWVVDANADLVAGGMFMVIGALPTRFIARWDGSQWFPIGGGTDGEVDSLAIFGGDLIAGGKFQMAGSTAARRLARWDGAQWNSVGGGADGTVFVLTTSAISGATNLYAGGLFENAGAVSAKHIAQWDGVAWSALGSGLSTPGDSSVVYAITEFDLGNGPRLAVGGVFSLAGGQPAANIATWDGVSWSPLESGVDGAVRCLAVFDDGSGPALYAGGAFESAGGIPAKRVARWNGSTWSTVGGNGSWGGGSTVHAMEVFDDSDGPRLIVGGDFIKADDGTAPRLASWDGAQWSVAFNGADSRVSTLFVEDSAPEARLMVGGLFTQTGGVPANSTGIRVGCPVSALPGDLNGDGIVDTADLGVLLSNFGTANQAADLNNDGIVDTADLGLLLANFGA